ncbi:hypothetical protein [Roseivirga sp.]|uniref:hypothetical protein n=1 Tax=Roseivirga sp. TaxID=1964215 RepID=UPI003B526DA1
MTIYLRGITILLLLGIGEPLLAQLESFNRYFIWNPDSTAIYESPDLNSSEVIRLPYGTEVVRLDVLPESELTIMIGELDGTPDRPERLGGYTIQTFWVQVKYGDYRGYALNAEVINFPPSKLNDWAFFQLDPKELESSFGMKSKRYKTTKSIKWKNWDGYYEVKVDSLVFADGSYHVTEYFDGCFNRTYYYSGKSLDQVYYLMITNYYSRILLPDGSSSASFPRLKDIEPGKLLFHQIEAHEDLFLDFSKAKITFGSIDCT